MSSGLRGLGLLCGRVMVEQQTRHWSECRTVPMDRIVVGARGYWECAGCGWISLDV